VGKSLEIWICTTRNPLELMSLISTIESDCEEGQLMTGLATVRVIYNGSEVSSSELLATESIFSKEIKNISTKINSSQPFSLSSARNFALYNSTADWGIYLDDDVKLTPGFLKSAIQAVDHATENHCVLLGGRVQLSGAPLGLDEIHKIFLSQLDHGSPSRVLESEFINGACFGLDRSKILEMSLQFSDQLGRKGSLLLSGEESLLTSQVRELGGSVWYEHNLNVNHVVEPERLTANWLLKRMAWEAVTGNIIKANLGSIHFEPTECKCHASHDDVMSILKYKRLIESALEGDIRILDSFLPKAKSCISFLKISYIFRNFIQRTKAHHFFSSTTSGRRILDLLRMIKVRIRGTKF
jgi:hypothetical protein